MYRSFALKLGSYISRPTCLHLYRPVHLMTRKSIDEKQMFVSSHQLLQKQKECLIPNKDLSQEIGEGIHDLEVTKAKWQIAGEDFCKKIDLSPEQFCMMNRRYLLLKYVETIEHLSKIADVLIEYSYGPVIKHLMIRNLNRICLISVESLRSALEEHGRDILEVMLQSSNVQQTEYMNLKLQYPLTAKAIEYSLKQFAIPQNHFPWKKLTEKSKPYENIAKLLGDELGVDQRVVDAIWPSSANERRFWQFRERLVFLEKEGFEIDNIFENVNFVKLDIPNLQFKETIENIGMVGGRKYLEFSPLESKLLMTRTLSRLFKCTKRDFKLSEIRFFYGKSKRTVVTVFFLLIDEGFHMEEIRKYIFLLGVPENEIRHYLKSYNIRSLTIENERREILRNMHEDLVLARKAQGEL